MSGFHDQQSGARSQALPAGGHTSSGAFATPGKRTLTEGITGARGSGPIQLQGDGQSHPIPSDAFVNQYGPDSKPGRLNDCGPSCILMALRAMGLEQKLKDQMTAEFQPINDQSEVEFICDLWTWCKLNLPPPADLDAYLHGEVASDAKRETIGRMAVRRGRLEFLLGWLLQGGIQSNGINWEIGPGTNTTPGSDGEVTDHSANAGPIVSQYESGTNNAGHQIEYGAANQDWCGMFIGFCMGRLGMSEIWSGGPSDHLALESSYHANEFIQAKLAAVADGGSLGTGEVIILPDVLPVAPAPGEPPPRAMEGPPPQAGDIAVFAQHIAMIESYDPSALQITTIEGNVGLQRTNAVGDPAASNSVSGYRYTTQEFKDAHGGLMFIWRPSLEAFGATTTGTSTDNTAGDALVQQLDAACDQVSALYQQLGLPGAPSSAQAVADIAAGSVAAPAANPPARKPTAGP